MTWTMEQKISSMLQLPWTVTSDPADDPGEFIVRVKELPGVVVIGTEAEIEGEFWDALRLAIETRLEHNEPPTLPPKVQCLPWEQSFTTPRVVLAHKTPANGSTAALSQPLVFTT